ncbi:AMP-binding protein [Siccirubricoccus sp. KC 17139]|uniref:AMP-binding protein n=1 Tax=Siccirubricoccus soli TaxID=2899147 RepID=A0ABT1CYH2_9PROT|nr:AMP-binding protein [Siccirubricoccus soli]MCO6414717.1 AMP-binding protein [Siccirubricoccus soli]MCP2680847.1 AMP-binding protein [Siccirubricoccus soli]
MLHRWLDRHAARTPDRVALRHGAEAITYAGLAAQAAALAGGLGARGIGRGDRVAFLGLNHPAQLVLLAACARLGAILVPLNWRLAAPELRFMLEDSGARLLFALPEHLALAEAALPPACALLAPAAPPTGPAPPALGEAGDALLLIYTSGTTGRPKGAVLDQRALLANALNGRRLHALGPADRVLTVLPMFHVGGLNIQTVPALLAGATVLLHPRFEPDAFFDTLAAERPTLTLLVPAVMQALVAHPRWKTADLSCLRAIGAGSSDVPLPLIEAFQARGVPVQQVYGATETSPIALYQSVAEAMAHPGSIGRPAALCDCRVVDAAGRPLPPGEAGEIEVRGPNVMRGYWKAPEATAAALRQGWFRTGDVGIRDAAGRFWFTDRLKHLIISGGENIYPAEVERVLREAPGVAEGAVCGRPDLRWGEVPVALVVPGEGFDPDAVLRFFEGRLARFKHPRAVIAVPSLPRTALGKVQVEALRAMAAGAHS